jgi:hypothetical protein
MHVFIVGAPRCGTTAVSRALKAHPDICFSKPKEPQFFTTANLRGLTDGALARHIHTAYVQQFFQACAPASQILAEGSVSYLYSAAAIRTILRWNPAARFIVMLRDPLEMLPSYHARLHYLLDEDEPDFNRAWALQDERRAGRRVPRTCRDPQMLKYADVARLGAYTENLMAIAGGCRVLPLFHEDLARDPCALYARVLAFIGVRDDGRTSFPLVRCHSAFRSRALQMLLQRPPRAWLRMAVGAAADDGAGVVPRGGSDGRAGPGRRRFTPRKLRKHLLALNTVERPHAAIAPDVRASIQAALGADVARLEALTGRDLGHWLNGAVSGRRPYEREPASTAGA